MSRPFRKKILFSRECFAGKTLPCKEGGENPSLQGRVFPAPLSQGTQNPYPNNRSTLAERSKCTFRLRAFAANTVIRQTILPHNKDAHGSPCANNSFIFFPATAEGRERGSDGQQAREHFIFFPRYCGSRRAGSGGQQAKEHLPFPRHGGSRRTGFRATAGEGAYYCRRSTVVQGGVCDRTRSRYQSPLCGFPIKYGQEYL